MKTKIISFVTIILLMAFMLPNIVWADMGSPVVNTYTVYVTNPNGINYYSLSYDNNDNEKFTAKGKYESGSKIEISSEYEAQDETKYGIVFKDFDQYYINLNDVSKVSEIYSDYDASTEQEGLVLASEGIEMYAGPAYGYESTGVTIPKDTKIKCYESKENTGENPWFYTTYNGVNGWICELNGTIGLKSKYYNELIMPVDRNIYKDSEKTEGIGAIPANTVITDFLDLDQWSQTFYVTYNGVSGYISNYDCAVDSDENYNTWSVDYSEAKMYEKATTNSKVVIDNVEKGTSLKSKYVEYDLRGAGWIYTTLNGVSGWVLVTESDFSNGETKLSDLSEYDDNKEENILKYITEDMDDGKLENEEEQDENVVSDKEEKDENAISNKEEQKTTGIVLNQMQILIICVVVAVVIAVMAIVIIVLVNKLHKKQN